MLLEKKNAIIYGSGDLGAAIARTFAREGARVFIAGRNRAALDGIAAEIAAAGGSVEVAEVDALDEAAVDQHLRDVAARAGSVDVSFNLISRGDVQGIALVEMTAADLLRAVTNGLMTQFLTARAAARRMVQQRSGVILSLNSGSGGVAVPMMGSTPAADAAGEAFFRCLAAEVGPQGVRVVGIHTAAVADTLTPAKLAAVNSALQLDAAGVAQLIENISAATTLRRLPRSEEVADAAAFLASDKAGAVTGTVFNVSAGLIPD